MSTINCDRCGRELSHPVRYREKYYGSRCYQIVKNRTEANEENEYRDRCHALVKALKEKDMSNITNNFKLDFIPSVIGYYEKNGRLTEKQYEVAYDMLNQKDWRVMTRESYRLGVIDQIDFYSLMALNSRTGSQKWEQWRQKDKEARKFKGNNAQVSKDELKV